nr:MAG TPA: hypothetical protein [Caudoviricetes sp.]
MRVVLSIFADTTRAYARGERKLLMAKGQANRRYNSRVCAR